jgi:hypothetical protein
VQLILLVLLFDLRAQESLISVCVCVCVRARACMRLRMRGGVEFSKLLKFNNKLGC